MKQRKPAEIFPPGEYLHDELEARGWNQGEFAEIIGRPPRLISEIISGKRGITPETAQAIAAAFGTSAEFWLNLESAYQLSRVDPVPERIRKEAQLREKFPVREMIKRGWIESSKNFEVIETRVLDFFGITSLDDMPKLSHAARRNYSENLSSAQLAWIFRVKHLATALQIPKYNEQKLRSALVNLELLMTEPEEARHIPGILSECGVRFVIVEPIPGSKIDGVCFWLNAHSPVIGLSLKGDYIDRFWFTLRHEIEHVLRGDGKDSIMVDEFEANEPASNTNDCEKAANQAASNFCVPEKEIKHFIARLDPMYSEKNLIGFARLIKRHPGIVAGQLQRRTERWDLFRRHQLKVRHIIIQSALTDGYGHTGPINI